MNYIHLGKIVNTHGLKGELKVVCTTDFKAERYHPSHPLFIKTEKGYDKVFIKSYRVLKGFDLITIKGLEHINLTEKYKGFDLYSEDTKVEQLEQNEFHVADLIGLAIYQGSHLKGYVFQIRPYPQGDYLDIERLDKSHSLVPFRDEFVLSVDLDKEKIVVVEMEGLL